MFCHLFVVLRNFNEKFWSKKLKMIENAVSLTLAKSARFYSYFFHDDWQNFYMVTGFVRGEANEAAVSLT